MLDILIGGGLGALLIACGAVPRHILWCRQLDRRFDLEIKARDAGRDKAWRELGVSEETIAQFYTRRAEYLNDPEVT